MSIPAGPSGNHPGWPYSRASTIDTDNTWLSAAQWSQVDQDLQVLSEGMELWIQPGMERCKDSNRRTTSEKTGPGIQVKGFSEIKKITSIHQGCFPGCKLAGAIVES